MWPSLSVFEVRFRGFDGCLFYTIIRAPDYSSSGSSPWHHWNIGQVVVLFLFQTEWWLMSCLFSSHVQTSLWRWTPLAWSVPLQRPDSTVTSTVMHSATKLSPVRTLTSYKRFLHVTEDTFVLEMLLPVLSGVVRVILLLPCLSEKWKKKKWWHEWKVSDHVNSRYSKSSLFVRESREPIATRGCSSDANPAATKAWYKKNVYRPSFLLGNGPQLVVSHIQPSRSGEYYCTGENGSGRRTSHLRVWNVSETTHPELSGTGQKDPFCF